MESLLGKTKDGKQMSDKWVDDRLEKAVSNLSIAKDIRNVGYDKWLMIVNIDGTVVEIYQLDKQVNIIKTISTN